MANVNVSVKAALKYYSGTAATSVIVKAVRQSDPTLAADMNTADIIEATSNSSTGIVELTLVGTDDVPVSYKIQLPDQQYFYLNIPKNAKATNLGIITVSPSPSIGVKNITGQIDPVFEGQTITAAATIVPTCSVHKITGATSVTAITATEYPIGRPLTLVGAINFSEIVNGANIMLNTATNANLGIGDTLVLITDGTKWYQVGGTTNN